ncbi:outer membrane transport energization protein TonB [Sinobacterium caligoides]|uniref:Outer membrane transport energization protein TonB n=1 Tax=Sinobacterium caligoides TaxID=933926 RepID=A0A3N2DGG2_9GAMM|nr:energy transducer TonB [Sinobacterium caligoides]ROR98839.1 outer membrane transport energization protein TonB [Sinobacterium caligoides]
MSLVRLLIGGLFGALVTAGLFVIMYSLIEFSDRPVDDSAPTKIASIDMPDTEIDPRSKEVKPDKPEDPETPPPEMESPEIEDFDVDVGGMNMGFTPKADVQISAAGITDVDGEFLPIVKVQPIYPRRAASRGTEGYCIVEYTVTKNGSIRDPIPVDCQPGSIFNRASVKAALKFKYKPRVIDGVAQDVPGVRNKFTYQLAK